MAGQDSRVGDRQVTSMRIKLKYPDVDTFIQKYAVNISRGGIFIATKQPKPVGTFVKFEFLLSNAESQSIIRGEGQVQWTKEFDPQNPGKAHGMGVKFLRLDSTSQQVIDRALRWRAEHGTSPNAQLPGAGSSAHAMVTTRDSSQPNRLLDLADAEEHTTSRRRQSDDRDDLAASEDVPTAVRDASQSGRLPAHEAAPPQAELAQAELAQAEPPRAELPPAPEPPAEATAVMAMPPMPSGRRQETRPIAISHDDDDERPMRARNEQTRPIPLGARGRDEIDALAHEWGLSEEKLARSLKKARPRIVEATAELERLLLKPPKPPAPSKAEAMEKLAALLERRAVRVRESNGNGAAHDDGDAGGARSDAAPAGEAASAAARPR